MSDIRSGNFSYTKNLYVRNQSFCYLSIYNLDKTRTPAVERSVSLSSQVDVDDGIRNEVPGYQMLQHRLLII
jgi:hypothetical protein